MVSSRPTLELDGGQFPLLEGEVWEDRRDLTESVRNEELLTALDHDFPMTLVHRESYILFFGKLCSCGIRIQRRMNIKVNSLKVTYCTNMKSPSDM